MEPITTNKKLRYFLCSQAGKISAVKYEKQRDSADQAADHGHTRTHRRFSPPHVKNSGQAYYSWSCQILPQPHALNQSAQLIAWDVLTRDTPFAVLIVPGQIVACLCIQSLDANYRQRDPEGQENKHGKGEAGEHGFDLGLRDDFLIRG